MGTYDREYYRDPPHRSSYYGGGTAWSVNTWLIVINVGVFLLNNLVVADVVDPFGNVLGRYHPVERWGWFSVTTALVHLQVWRFLTFQFLHANFDHILMNMVGLFFFGPLIETYLGSRRYLTFYLLCGVAGPVAYILLWAAGLLSGGPASPLVGASAGIFGVLVAGATVAPNSLVLIWGILPVRLRTFAWGLMAIAAFTIFTSGNNAGGQAAHLGGAAAGFWLIRDPRVLNALELGRRARPRMRYRP